MDTTAIPVFDGHNDVLTKIYRSGGVPAAEEFLSDSNMHIDLGKARRGKFVGGFFAIWVASPDSDVDYQSCMEQPPYDLPLPDALGVSEALSVVMAETAILRRLEALGALQVCTSVAQIRQCMDSDKIAAIMHMEGAEAIDPDFHSLEVLYQAGLRSLGPVWSRPTIYAEGVPFRYPSGPDIGGGLTALGQELIRRCNRLRIMIDLSHLNEAGFWDVARLSEYPLVATHSNAAALCPHARNLTDKQLAAIADSGGIVGLNFATAFLREDGKMIEAVPVEQMLRHLDHLLQILGEDGVGIGSDFDGATIPSAIGDVAGLPVLTQAMQQHGYNDVLVRKMCYENWMRVLDITWRAT